jgi:hypothetical protein
LLCKFIAFDFFDSGTTSGGGKDQGQLGNQYADPGDILCTHLLISAQRKLKLIQTQSQAVDIQPFFGGKFERARKFCFGRIGRLSCSVGLGGRRFESEKTVGDNEAIFDPKLTFIHFSSEICYFWGEN